MGRGTRMGHQVPPNLHIGISLLNQLHVYVLTPGTAVCDQMSPSNEGLKDVIAAETNEHINEAFKDVVAAETHEPINEGLEDVVAAETHEPINEGLEDVVAA
eukprot:jgi/Chrzof1/2220/Cz11g07060.t1